MFNLTNRLQKLKSTDVSATVGERLSEFKKVGQAPNERWFSELCFCILTANSRADLGIKIQQELAPQGFLKLPKPDLARGLRELGHRFYRTRAEYIVEARRHRDLKTTVTELPSASEAREWLVKNIKGLGYKEASHFLRNVGFENVAILDRHVLRIIHQWGIVDRVPKTLTRKKYLEVEGKLGELAEKVEMSLAELDLYLWYTATGKVLK
jgi:N-glycosylase/DNA lyase